MKTLKYSSIAFVLLALVGASVYMPMSRHVVVYDGKSHVVQKDKMGWDHTYLNLDKEPMKWRVVFQSKTLKTYFMKHYAKVAEAKARRYAASWWKRMKSQATQAIKRSGKWLKEQGPKELKKLGDKAKDGLKAGVKAAKAQGDKLMK